MSFCFKYNKYINNYNLISRKYGDKTKYQSTDINSIEFVNQHSVCDDGLLFTNRLQRASGNRIDVLINVISDLMNNPNNLDKYFEGKDISFKTLDDKRKLDRLDQILKLHDEVPDNEFVFKYAPNQRYYNKYNQNGYERGFQLFYTRDSNNDVKIYLIDLYHLVIPSKTNNTRSEYVDKKNYKHDIYDCIFCKIKEKSTTLVG